MTEQQVVSDAATLSEWAAMLAEADTGIGFIYEALDELAAHYELADAVLSVDGGLAGPQLFRLGRTPVDDAVLLDEVARSTTGLVTEPDVVDEVTASCVTHLAQVALRMDLLGHDTSHDALTGLLNRRSYDVFFSEAVSRSRRYGWSFALVLLDVDNFKQFNDDLGHLAGDQALRTLGGEVRAVLRSGDAAARLGGDEFALIVQNAEHSACVDPLLTRIRAALERRPPTSAMRFSAGVAYFPGDAGDGEALSRVADTRLYAAKSHLIRPLSPGVSQRP